jgi:hypothetical protein
VAAPPAAAVAAEAVAAGKRVRLPKAQTIWIYVSLPFLAVAGTLLVISGQQDGPWEALGYAFFAVVALLAWGGVTFFYCLYLLVANGLVAGNIVPGLFVAAVIVGAGLWGWTTYREDRDCDYAMTFYEELANAAPEARAALIAANRDVAANPTVCRTEALFYWFGHDRFDPNARNAEEESRRLATLALLLKSGLPPGDEVVWHAVNDADAGLFELLMARRAELHRADVTTWDPAPASVAFDVVSQLDVDPDSLYFADAPAFREMLSVLRNAGVDLCAEDDFGKTLGARMAAKDLIADDELPDCR